MRDQNNQNQNQNRSQNPGQNRNQNCPTNQRDPESKKRDQVEDRKAPQSRS